MNTILETKLFFFRDEEIQLQFVRRDNGSHYAQFKSKSRLDINYVNDFKIEGAIFSELIAVFQNFYAVVSQQEKVFEVHLTERQITKIVDSYMRGVTVNDLALQMGQTQALIEQVLLNRGLVVLNNKIWKQGKNRRKF
jgi:hypothetical protein